MPLGLTGRLKEIDRQLDEENSYVDCSIQLEVYNKDGPTGVLSPVLGGVYGVWEKGYIVDGECTPQTRPVTQAQFDYCLSRKSRITGKGGRGGGKTESLAQRAECLLIGNPGEHGLIVSPDYPHTRIVWDAILARVFDFTLPGTRGIHRTNRTIRLINGSSVQFLSADNPDSLRGWNAHWCGVDEEKDITDEAIDIAMLCLRESSNPLIFGAGTPEVGQYQDRFERMQKSDRCDTFSFPSKENVFIPHDVFELAAELMDELRYRQEVLAEFVELEPIPFIAKRHFKPEIHCTNIEDSLLEDITSDVTRKFGVSKSYIIGADYNPAIFDAAWVYKVYYPNVWVLVDIVRAHGPTSATLAQALIDKGYDGKQCFVVDDASGDWNAYGGKQSPNSSTRIMRKFGFHCIHNPKNPNIKDRINAFLAKFAPSKGLPTWKYAPNVAVEVEEVMNKVKLKDNLKDIDKDDGVDHDFDAGTYPIAKFCPAAHYNRTKGFAANG